MSFYKRRSTDKVSILKMELNAFHGFICAGIVFICAAVASFFLSGL